MAMKRTEKNRVEKLPDTDYTKKRSQLKMIMFRYSKNKLAVLGLIILIILSLCAIFADVIADYDTMAIEQHIMEKLQPPSKEHWFGTDHYGRDVFARIVHGARISLSMGIGTVFVSLAVGSLFGALAGYYGGKVDNIIMRVMDVLGAIPGTLLAISIAAVLGRGIVNLILALGISAVPLFARIVRANVLTVKSKDYVEAGKCVGASDARLILKHMIPNAMGPIIVQATFGVASNILMIAGLSYIGLGIAPPTPEWGGMLSEAKTNIQLFWHPMVFPGVAIFLTSFSLNVLGDGLRDAFDPKLR